MTNSLPQAPKPEVVYLRQLLRSIDRGEYRVPAFQRGYVWTQDKVLKLLESVLKGYPIGSLLLWKSQTKQLELAEPDGLPYPDLEERYPTTYILDGLQRSGALYGTFYSNHGGPNAVFLIGYDLREEEFVAIGTDDIPSHVVPLRDLFDSSRLLARHAAQLAEDDGQQLVERSVEVLSVFQEYMVATVTIEGREVGDVVEIFERINSTGTPLNSIDFMRAATWSPSFDLNESTDSIVALGAAAGVELSPDTVVKLLALAMGKSPLPSSMLELRDASAEALHSGVERVRDVLADSLSFLKQHIHIRGADFLPYEGILLVVFNYHLVRSTEKKQSTVQDQALSRWAWSIAFSEGLRGRPDNYVARTAADAAALANDPTQRLTFRFSVTANDLIEKRFIRGKARSSAVVLLFAARGAMDLLCGQLIERGDYLDSFESSQYSAVLSSAELEQVLGHSVHSNKVFANTVLTPNGKPPEGIEEWAAHCRKAIETWGRKRAVAVFESQAIGEAALMALVKCDAHAFLRERAAYMVSAMARLSEAPGE